MAQYAAPKVRWQTPYSTSDFETYGRGGKAATFSIKLDENSFALFKRGAIAATADNARTKLIIHDRLGQFSDQTLVPALKAAAPVKPGGGENSKYAWESGTLLRDSIRGQIRGETLAVSMAQKGRPTMTGRKGFSTGSPIRIELPGGEVIYRMSVQAATIFPLDGESPTQRMRWFVNTYRSLERAKAFESLGRQMLDDILAQTGLTLKFISENQVTDFRPTIASASTPVSQERHPSHRRRKKEEALLPDTLETQHHKAVQDYVNNPDAKHKERVDKLTLELANERALAEHSKFLEESGLAGRIRGASTAEERRALAQEALSSFHERRNKIADERDARVRREIDALINRRDQALNAGSTTRAERLNNVIEEKRSSLP